MHGSAVVIFTVLFLMFYLAGADWFIGNIARLILLGRA